MIKIIPIAVATTVSNKHKTISSNKHYAAYVSNSLFYGKNIHIINLRNKANITDFPKDFKYNISRIFKKIEVYQITFNNESNKLYCLAKKGQYTKLYQFNLRENLTHDLSRQWHKYKTTPIAFDVKTFTMNEITKELHLLGFTKNKICYAIQQTTEPQELIKRNIADVNSNITKIKLDSNNMQISVLSENKELNIFNETNNGWQITNTLYDCNDIPSYSPDGNILVFKELNQLVIRLKLPEGHSKKVYKVNFQYPIADFSINTTGNKITVFNYKRDYEPKIYYSTIYHKGDPVSWFSKTYSCPLKICVRDRLYDHDYYLNNISSMFSDENKLMVLFSIYDFNLTFYSYINRDKKAEIVDEEKIATRKGLSRTLRLQNNATGTRRYNSSQRYDSSRRYNNTNNLFYPVASTSYTSYCSGDSGGSFYGGCDGGSFSGDCDGDSCAF